MKHPLLHDICVSEDIGVGAHVVLIHYRGAAAKCTQCSLTANVHKWLYMEKRESQAKPNHADWDIKL